MWLRFHSPQRFQSALEKREQVRVDDISMGRNHAVREILVRFQRAVFEKLR